MMQPAELHSWKIRKLHDHLLEKRFAVPKLQRNFVWDGRRAAKLFDSIYRNMPIGSLFLWEMNKKSASMIRQSTKVLPAFSTRNPKIWFVIDGQQRLSVIHQSRAAEMRKNDAGKTIDFRRLCFVVNPDPKDRFAPRIVFRKEVEREFVPLADILAPDWKKRTKGGTVAFQKKITHCRERLLNYAVPVVKVASATLPEIAEVFTRVNSLGTKVSAADRAIALMGKLDVHLMADELRQKVLESQFALHDISPILMGFNLVTDVLDEDGDPPKLDQMAKNWSRKIDSNKNALREFEKTWHRFREAFLSAIQYLRLHFPVHDETFLPSANMLSTFCVFFFHHKGQPNARQATEIRKWFWATGIAKRYSGAGYHKHIVQDAKLFRSLANGKLRYFHFKERLDPVLAIQGESYNAGSARTRAFFCLLASLKPRYLENGEAIPLGQGVIAQSSRTDRHHIFPRAQLDSYGFPSGTYDSLCNICLLVSLDNQRIGKKLPRVYLADYRSTGKSFFKTAMKSHLIPVQPDSGVWQSATKAGFRQFRAERLKAICRAFEERAGIKLFQPV